MASHVSILFNCFSFVIFSSMIISSASADEDRKLHIVYMGSLPQGKYSPLSHQLSFLQQVTGSRSSAEDLLITSYWRSFNGFAAMLTDFEARKLESRKEIVSVFPSEILQLQTTRSWSFIGFDDDEKRNQHVESDIIIGVIDTGIWLESPSFSSEGYGPPPKTWKGSCRGGKNFTCNNKVIGARYYTRGSPGTKSARDDIGHGTHTASTAAGNKVKDASFLDIAQGTAKGGVPSARIAVYKVCNPEGCNGADILAAFDDAIADGVDFITISLGHTRSYHYYNDPIAIGAFHAMVKGIFTSHSAGNEGPTFGSISSVAPWLLSVAASSTDRRIIDKVVLGNGKTLIGNSVNAFTLEGRNYPLAYGENVSTKCSDKFARYCIQGCLDSSLVKGKIVVCDHPGGKYEAMRAGAVGSIVSSQGYDDDVSFVVPFPALNLNHENFEAVKSYMNSTSHPVANILKSESIQDSSAPVVASFSSLGPNMIVLDLMKPDISAPGMEILAAFPADVPPTDSPFEKRRVKFNILSGTSMACPHAAGVAAYVKTFHPEWSPSAIKSAIMTTAFPMNNTINHNAEFAYGSGHINPFQAIDPGLVYETHKSDYIKFLCSLDGYNEKMIRLISKDNRTCPENSRKASPVNLNYPSMTARVVPDKFFRIKFSRKVTNIGNSNSTYKASVFTSSRLVIRVIPEMLSFKFINQKKSFAVTVIGGGLRHQEKVSASLVWSDEIHEVRSPIVVHAHKL